MEILYIAPSLPNDFSRIRSKNIIKAFKKFGCNVTLLSLYDKESDLIYVEEMKKIVNDIILYKQSKFVSLLICLIGIFTKYPLRVSYVYNFKMHKFLKKINKQYDLVYVKRLRMAQYAKYFENSKVYVDITDSLTKYYDRIRKQNRGIKKIISEEEYFKHKIYESIIVQKYRTVICSEEDKKYLEKKNHIILDSMITINNSIDTEKWINKSVQIKPKNKRKKIVFSGMMDYEPNILAVNYIVNKVVPLLDDTYEIYFVGKNCSDNLKKMENKNIHFVGFVSDMKIELQKYDMYICPIIAGSGVKNKILQAASVGVPIVSNNLGIEGIEKEIKEFVFLGNTPEEMVKQIKKINELENKVLLTIIKNQQKFIIKKYDISVGIEKVINQKCKG